MAKKSAHYKDWFIEIEESGSVKVSKKGKIASNTKAALREISEATGFDVEEKWNTQQHGAKLVRFLEESFSSIVEKPKAKKTKAKKKDGRSQARASKADIAGGIPWWVWALITAIVVLLYLLLFGRKKAEPQVAEVEKVVVTHDTLYAKQIAEIEEHYNEAVFVVGKADLSDDAKFVLHDLAKVMKDNPEIRLRLEGHTSAEGDAAFNQRLSEARAQAAVDFMINHEGIAADRLEAIGKGTSEPKNLSDPTSPENRRTEFIVIE